MNEIWKTKAELSENSQGFVSDEMHCNRVVRLARGVRRGNRQSHQVGRDVEGLGQRRLRVPGSTELLGQGVAQRRVPRQVFLSFTERRDIMLGVHAEKEGR